MRSLKKLLLRVGFRCRLRKYRNSKLWEYFCLRQKDRAMRERNPSSCRGLYTENGMVFGSSLFICSGNAPDAVNSRAFLPHFAEHNFKLMDYQIPILVYSRPLFRDVLSCQIQHFKQTVVVREYQLSLCNFTKLAV